MTTATSSSDLRQEPSVLEARSLCEASDLCPPAASFRGESIRAAAVAAGVEGMESSATSVPAETNSETNCMSSSSAFAYPELAGGRGAEFEYPVDVKTAARFLGVSASLVYAYVERKQIPHFRMMGRAIRFRLSELDGWRRQFHVNGGIDE